VVSRPCESFMVPGTRCLCCLSVLSSSYVIVAGSAEGEEYDTFGPLAPCDSARFLVKIGYEREWY